MNRPMHPQAAHAAPPPPPPQPFRPPALHSASPSRAGWWWAAAGFAAGMALLGVLQPRAAVAAAMIAAIGLAGVIATYTLARLLHRVRPAPRSEFAPAIYERPPQKLPHHIARVAPDPDDRNPPLRSGARVGVTTVATERLWASHGLNLHDPAHQPAIERLVSPALWGVIRPDRADRNGHLTPRPKLLHRDLDRLLDELERL